MVDRTPLTELARRAVPKKRRVDQGGPTIVVETTTTRGPCTAFRLCEVIRECHALRSERSIGV